MHPVLPVIPARRPGAHESVRQPGRWLGFTKDRNGVTTAMCNHHHETATAATTCAEAMVALDTEAA